MANRRSEHPSASWYNSKRCRCDECKAAWAAKQREYRSRHPESRGKYLAYQRERRRKLRREVLDHYGGACACCGESTLEFLALDHKNGGGTKHRNELGLRGSAIWAWAKREGYPAIFQVMCHNCNQAKGYYGRCPHQA